MQRSSLVLLTLMVSFVMLQDCAHSTLETKIDREISQETAIKSHSDLRAETGKLIETSPGLTADQRKMLAALHDSTRTKLDQLWSESLKLRSVLIKDLMAAKYDEDEVELVKRRIKDVDEKRLSITFDAIEKANVILGRDAVENPHIIEGLWESRSNRD